MAIPAWAGAMAASAVGSVLDSVLGGDAPSSGRQATTNALIARGQLAEQRRFNKDDAINRSAWLVRGAKKAGVHPALLFGGSAMSPPSWSIGGSASVDSGQGNHFASLGQDISRAMMAQRTAEERSSEAVQAQARLATLDKLNEATHAANIRKTEMETALLASQLKRMEAAQVPPPKPSNTNGVETFPYNPNKADPARGGKWESIPAEVISHDPGSPANEAGPPSPSMKTMRFGGPNLGFNYDLPGQSASEALESVGAIPASAAVWGHNMARSADKLLYGDPATIPKGYKGVKWRWNRWKQKWVAEKGGK